MKADVEKAIGKRKRDKLDKQNSNSSSYSNRFIYILRVQFTIQY